MSIKALNWAMHQVRTDGPSAQAVLFIVADTANAEGVSRHADPDYIAERSRQSRATVFRRLAELEHFGALVRVSEIAPDGRRRYELRLQIEREIDYDGEMLAAMRRHDGSEEAETPSTEAPIAPGGSQIETEPGSQIETDPISPVRPIQSHSCDPLKNPRDSKKEIPPTPFQGALNEAGRKRFQEFKSTYPDGIVDLQAAEMEYAGLTEADQAACNAAALAYAERCRRRREKSLKAHLFVRKRAWDGLLASPEAAAGTSLHEPGSPVGTALRTLGRIARYTPFVLGDGRLSYRGEIGPRLLAMADTPPERSNDDPPKAIWQTYALGTPNFAAWRDFINEVFAGRALPRLIEVYAPWPWPPRRDGTQAATGPPAMLASDADLRDFAEMG